MNEFEHEHRALIAVAEACWVHDSYSWHVFAWMAYKLRRKYPLIRNSDRMIDLNMRIS